MQLPVKYNELTGKGKFEVRKAYIRIQEGKCSFCKYPLDGDPSPEVMKSFISEKWFPAGFFKNPIHLHHDHNSGYTIGAVHCRCNAYLWQYKGE